MSNVREYWKFRLRTVLKLGAMVKAAQQVEFDANNFSKPRLEFDKVPFAFDFRKLGYQQIALDIGCGNGEFTHQWATMHSDTLVLGSEVVGEQINKGIRHARTLGLANIKFLHADALKVLHFLIADASLATIFVNFPDPWNKRRHFKRRMHTVEFWQLCLRRLEPGGEIHFISDHQEIYSFALQQVQTLCAAKIAVTVSLPPADYPKSKYARKWERMGRTFQYFCVTKFV